MAVGQAPATRRTSKLRPPNVPMPAMAGIRGLAAMAVLLFHVASQPGITLGGKPAEWIAPLAIVAVGIFIGMSGLFLFHPMSMAHMQGTKHRPLDFYFARRLGRIYPPYWVALFAWVVIFGHDDVHGWEWIPMLTLTHVVFPDLASQGLYVSWTLSVEVTFYLLLPVLYFGLRRLVPIASTTVKQRFHAQLLLVGFVYLFGLFFRTFVLMGPDSWLKYTKYLLPNFLDGFGGGMLFAVLLSWRKLGNALPGWFEWLVRHPWVCLVFALEIYWVGTTLGFPPGLQLAGLPPSRLFIFAASLLLIIPLLCVPAIFDEHGAKPYHRFFGSTPLLWLGGISYGVYLWNLTWADQVTKWRDSGSFPDGFWPALAATIVLSCIVAAASYLLLEAPTMRRVKRYFQAREGREIDDDAAMGAIADAPGP